MNSDPEMLTYKLQTLASSAIPNKQKVLWLMQWSKSNVLKQAKKFPIEGFFDSTFDRWVSQCHLLVSGTSFYILSITNFWPNFKDLQLRSIPMHLKVEVHKFYALIIMDLALSVRDTSNLSSLSDYIKEWKLIAGETTFFKQFKSKDEI